MIVTFESHIFFSDVSFFLNKRLTLIRKMNKIGLHISNINWSNLESPLLLGNPSFSKKTNTLILDTCIAYIVSTKRFNKPHKSYILLVFAKSFTQSLENSFKFFTIIKYLFLSYLWCDLPTQDRIT